MVRGEACVMNINLHIDRIVLDEINLERSESFILQTSISNTLTQLLTNRILTKDNLVAGVEDRLEAEEISIDNDMPNELAKKIAQSVYGGIIRE